ncbi:MAG: aminodeoxychorismate synthase, component I [Planctomyces sp.]|nr:aminodeoxychorismate synthase, component I [Planctomyces sp.]
MLPVVIPLTPQITPLSATQKLEHLPGLCVLESAMRSPTLGRYSYVMADPWHSDKIDTVPAANGDLFAQHSDLLRTLPFDRAPQLPPFQGGLVGVLSYEAGRAFDPMPSAGNRDFPVPEFSTGCYDVILAWDHEQGMAWLISQGWPETDPTARGIRAQARAEEFLSYFAENADRPSSPAALEGSRRPLADLTIPTFPLSEHPGVWTNFARDDYLESVGRVIAYIRAGDIFQANLTQRLLIEQTQSPLEIWQSLREKNPAPFMAFWNRPEWSLISSSPERFLKVRDRHVETRPIKGTRRRQGGEADLFLRDELRESQKDVAENVMIVDLLRNDLSRVCRPGSVKVPSLCEVETYKTVQHLVSVVTGELAENCDTWDALRATFPGGSITGAPKIRATQIIAELEPSVRGPYTGTLFYMTPDLWCDSSILIRTFVASQGWLQLGVGGGIVVNSDPQAEYEETLTKAVGMLSALNLPLRNRQEIG